MPSPRRIRLAVLGAFLSIGSCSFIGGPAIIKPEFNFVLFQYVHNSQPHPRSETAPAPERRNSRVKSIYGDDLASFHGDSLGSIYGDSVDSVTGLEVLDRPYRGGGGYDLGGGGDLRSSLDYGSGSGGDGTRSSLPETTRHKFAFDLGGSGFRSSFDLGGKGFADSVNYGGGGFR